MRWCQESNIFESSESLQHLLPESNDFLLEKQLHATQYGAGHYRNTGGRKYPGDYEFYEKKDLPGMLLFSRNDANILQGGS